MKNKFKKSKIIVPALALITATTVASVTGTVAWFTASRTLTVEQGNFITKTDGSGLKAVATGITNSGTTTVSNTSSAVTINGAMYHASYNATKNKTGNLYTATVSDDGVVTAFTDLGTVDSHSKTSDDSGTSYATNKWIAGTYNETSGGTSTSKNLWYAVAWKLKFTQETNTTTANNHLLLDIANTYFTDSKENATSTNSTQDGLRIALMTESNCIVIGQDDHKTHVVAAGARFKYTEADSSATWDGTTVYCASNNATKALTETEFNAVTDKSTLFVREINTYSTTNTSGTTADWVADTVSEGSTIYAKTKASHTKVGDNAENNGVTSDIYYLGQIPSAGLEVTCVAWYEGTDDAVTSYYDNEDTATERLMSNMKAYLEFYSRKVDVTTTNTDSGE